MKDEKKPKSGSHPVGTGVGAAGGAVTGAAIGTAVGGPAGTAVGGAVGAAAGALAGQGLAEAIDPAVEDAYWRENYTLRPYVDRGRRTPSTARPIAMAGNPALDTAIAPSTKSRPTWSAVGTRRRAHRSSRGARPRTPFATPGTGSRERSPATRTTTVADRISKKDGQAWIRRGRVRACAVPQC